MTADLTPCPTPDKRPFRSQADAARHQRERYVPGGGHKDHQYPYECPSGQHWHLTHQSPERQKQVGTAISRRPSAGLHPVASMFGGHQVRHVIADQPIWIARDVCEVIGISKYRDALAQLDADERVSVTVDTPGGPQQMSGVTEAGIWSLLLISRSPQVKPFKRWLTHEVLPTIRKTGHYVDSQNIALPDRKTLAQWVVDAEVRAEAAEAKVLELTPPAAAWNELADAAGDYSVADAAKVLNRDPAISTGERKLYRFMCGLGWVFRRDGRWKAYQAQVNNGRLTEKVNEPFMRNGELFAPAPTVRITPKGLAELHRRLGGTGNGGPLALAATS